MNVRSAPAHHEAAAPAADGYSVGAVARMSGITVRTLHHYEELGLLQPRRTRGGYRSYSAADLERLRHVLFYRELGMPLDEIGTLLDDPQRRPVDHLSSHRQRLQRRIDRLTEMLAAVDKELEADTMGTELTPEEKLEIFGAEYDPSWEGEAEERWGHTAAWQQSAQRTKRISKEQWRAIKADGDAYLVKIAAAKRRGVDPASAEAMQLAEEHRAGVEVFYDCSHQMQRGLADMYLADERFSKTYDDVEPGLAQWIHDAINANADRHGAPAHDCTAWQ